MAQKINVIMAREDIILVFKQTSNGNYIDDKPNGGV